MPAQFGSKLKRALDNRFDVITPAAGVGVGAGLLAQPEESEAAFGGVLARGADDFMLSIAKKMKAEDLTDDEIWRKTGWQLGIDDQWRFEIPESGRELAAPKFEQSYLYGYDAETVGDLLGKQDPVLLNYPDLADIELSQPQFGVPHSAGSYDPKSNRISINPNIPDQEIKDTIAHELQHAIQYKEDFGAGGSSDPKFKEMILNHIKSQYRAAGGHEAAQSDLSSEAAKLNRTYHYLKNRTPRELYETVSGEVEARNVEKRLDYPHEKRRKISPELTEDERRSSQYVAKMRRPVEQGALGVAATGAAEAATGGPIEMSGTNWYDRPRAALQGTLFGGLDEIASGLSAPITAAMTGNSIVSEYDYHLKRMRTDEEAYRSMHPVESVALEIGGGVLTGGAGFGRAMGSQAFKQAGRLGQAGITAGVGAAEGGLAGFLSSDEDRGEGALWGAGLGGLLGPLIPAAAKSPKSVGGVLSLVPANALDEED